MRMWLMIGATALLVIGGCEWRPHGAGASAPATSSIAERVEKLRPGGMNTAGGIIGDVVIAEALDRQTVQLKRIADALEGQQKPGGSGA